MQFHPINFYSKCEDLQNCNLHIRPRPSTWLQAALTREAFAIVTEGWDITKWGGEEVKERGGGGGSCIIEKERTDDTDTSDLGEGTDYSFQWLIKHTEGKSPLFIVCRFHIINTMMKWYLVSEDKSFHQLNTRVQLVYCSLLTQEWLKHHDIR